MSSYNTFKSVAGGGTFVVELNAPPGYPFVQVSFGRGTGSVTVKAKSHGGTKWLDITNGTLDLATKDSGRFMLDATAIQITDAGSGPLPVTVIQSN